MPHLFPRLAAALIPALLFIGRTHAEELDPVGPGPYAVGSTNLEVTEPADLPMVDYLNGKTTSARTYYIDDILDDRDSALVVNVEVPNVSRIYGSRAGKRLPVVLYVLYPTTRDNGRTDYVFPYKETGDRTFPHMQRKGEAPVFADPAAKYPLVVYSGGYNTHGLWHLEHLKFLASHGYVVVDIFHGDGRSGDFIANMALRALEFRASLDYVLQLPSFAKAIDTTRIGASGASAGGLTILTAMGGTDPKGRMPDVADPRIKAGFGVVPSMGGYFGIPPFGLDAWLFGENHEGLRKVRAPFFAVYGAADRNVVPAGVEDGVRAMSGPATAVILDGETHNLSNAANADAAEWEVLFFDSWLKGDATAREKLARGTSIRGGAKDHLTIHHGPKP